jgi:hypothetical protein
MKTLIAIWILCGVLAYGICFAYAQREWPALAEVWRREDIGASFYAALCGPLGLLAVLITTGFAKHGLKFY